MEPEGAVWILSKVLGSLDKITFNWEEKPRKGHGAWSDSDTLFFFFLRAATPCLWGHHHHQPVCLHTELVQRTTSPFTSAFNWKLLICFTFLLLRNSIFNFALQIPWSRLCEQRITPLATVTYTKHCIRSRLLNFFQKKKQERTNYTSLELK